MLASSKRYCRCFFCMNISIIMFGSFRRGKWCAGPNIGSCLRIEHPILEKAKLITIWAWEIFCMSYFVEEFKTIILGKKAKFLSMISDVVAALPFKNIMPSRHCLLT